MIAQAANTGLTGGSTPQGNYDRPVVVISTERLSGVFAIGNGTEAVCLSGSTLTQLEATITGYGRQPHSVIGSSCIGASVVGGICNNSGGALVERGPAFTQHALYARIRVDGQLELINGLGIELGDEPETMLSNLERGCFGAISAVKSKLDDYAVHLRGIDQSTPARYNADPRGLFEASGSAGKVIIFAVRVPTFPRPIREQTFICATNAAPKFADLRRALLDPKVPLPKLCEYLHRDATKLAMSHGNDICLLLKLFGPRAMPGVLKLQKRLAAFIGEANVDRAAQLLGRVAPHPLPGPIRPFFADYDHLLILTAADEAIEPVAEVLRSASVDGSIVVHRATLAEAEAALRLRFAVAGAGVRCRNLSSESNALASLDIAIPRNARDFRLCLPEELAAQVVSHIAYGHFLCHVFHHDFLLAPGVSETAFETAVKSLVEAKGGKMPAEHNFGHLYEAPQHVTAFYRELDPTNSLNPGIGKTSRSRNWN